MAWETGMAVCEINGTTGHDHASEPLACTNCGEFACDFHGDHSLEDEEWLCSACFAVERRRLQEAGVRRFQVEYTPGPPAIGVLTTAVVEADDADAAEDQIKDLHAWVMVHRVLAMTEPGAGE
jgi:hypothetical protein